MWVRSNGVQDRAVKSLIPRETFSCETPEGETDSASEATNSVYSGEERAGRRRVADFQGPAKGPAGVQWPNPLSFWFLLGDIRMLAGEARDIASDRAGFLGNLCGCLPLRKGRFKLLDA